MPKEKSFTNDRLNKVNKIFIFHDDSTFSTTAKNTFSRFNSQAPFTAENLVQYSNIHQDSLEEIFNKIKELQKEELFKVQSVEEQEILDKFWCVFFVDDNSMSTVHELCKKLHEYSTSIFKEFIFFSCANRIEWKSSSREYKNSNLATLINELSDITPLAYHFLLANEGENSSYSDCQLGFASSFYLHLLRLNFCRNPNLCFCGDFSITVNQPYTLGCQVYESRDDSSYEKETSFMLDKLLLDLWNTAEPKDSCLVTKPKLLLPSDVVSFLLPNDLYNTIPEGLKPESLQLLFDEKNIFSVSLKANSSRNSESTINYSGNFVEQILSLDEYKNMTVYFVKEYLTLRSKKRISLIEAKIENVILDNLKVANKPKSFLCQCRAQINEITDGLQSLTSVRVNGSKTEQDYLNARQSFISSSKSLITIYNVLARVVLVVLVFASFLIYPIMLRLVDPSVVTNSPYLPMKIWLPLVSVLSIYIVGVYFWASHKIKYGQRKVDDCFLRVKEVVHRMCVGELLSSSLQEFNVIISRIKKQYLNVVDEIAEENTMFQNYEDAIEKEGSKRDYMAKYVASYHKKIVLETGGTDLEKIKILSSEHFTPSKTNAKNDILNQISRDYLDGPWWNKTINVKTFIKAVRRSPIHGQSAKIGGKVYSTGNKSFADQIKTEKSCAVPTRTCFSQSAIVGVSLIELTSLRR